MAELAPVEKRQFFDSNGDPLSGGKVYTYEAGTSTPKATYTDREGLTANPNPIILDASGYGEIWIDSGYYKFVVKDSADVTQYTVDQISLPSEAALASAFYRDVVYITSADSPYSITQDHNGHLIHVDSTSGNVTITLPEMSSLTLPFNVAVKKKVVTNTVTVNRTGTDTIDGATSKSMLAANAGAHFIADEDQAPDDWTTLDLGTVSDGAITTAKLAAGVVNGANAVTAVLADSVLIADASDSGNFKKALVSTIKRPAVRAVTEAGNITAADEFIVFSGASFTATLTVSAVGNDGLELEFAHQGTSLSQVYTIDALDSETIDGSTTVKMHTNGQIYRIRAYNGNWISVYSKTNTAWSSPTVITIDATTTAPGKATTTVTDEIRWRRTGPDAHVRFAYRSTSAVGSAGGSGDYLFKIPTGLVIDGTKIKFYATTEGSGDWLTDNILGAGDTGTGSGSAVGHIIAYDADYVRLRVLSGSTSGVVGSGLFPITNNGARFVGEYVVPITDWLP